MKYYKVKGEADQTPRIMNGKRSSILIGQELYTPAEYRKVGNRPELFEVVNVKKTDTFFMFGARFAAGSKRA